MTAYRQQSEEYAYYYDQRQPSYEYMNHYPQNYQMGYPGNNGQGVLFTYLNQTNNNYMMYQQEHRRY